MRSLVLAIISFCALVECATLRSLYLDGLDLRIEVLFDKWWANGINETLRLSAGTAISTKVGGALVRTDQVLPLDMHLNLRNLSEAGTARTGTPHQSKPPNKDLYIEQLYPVFAAFPVNVLGSRSLSVHKVTQLSLPCQHGTLGCIQCSGSTYLAEKQDLSLLYAKFAEPAVSTASFVASITTAHFTASITWQSGFPKNQLGNSSTSGINAWTAFITGSQKDTGRLVQSNLSNYMILFLANSTMGR